MPVSSSAKKRVRQSQRKRLANRSVRSNLRTHIKKVETALEEQNLESAQSGFRMMESRLDRAARKGIIHKNAAARKKARLARRIKALASA